MHATLDLNSVKKANELRHISCRHFNSIFAYYRRTYFICSTFMVNAFDTFINNCKICIIFTSLSFHTPCIYSMAQTKNDISFVCTCIMQTQQAKHRFFLSNFPIFLLLKNIKTYGSKRKSALRTVIRMLNLMKN